MTQSQKLYTAEEMECAIRRMASAIYAEFDGDFTDCALVGIHHQGVPLAEKLLAALGKMGKSLPALGTLDISMYRDDIGNRRHLPQIEETVIPFDVNGCSIILVDDVLSSGRTIRAALDALTAYGRAGLIRLAVLVDRGRPEFPIRADFTGFHTDMPDHRKIKVRFVEDGDPGIFAVDWN